MYTLSALLNKLQSRCVEFFIILFPFIILFRASRNRSTRFITYLLAFYTLIPFLTCFAAQK